MGREMYDMIPVILGSIMLILGLVTLIFPKAVTKKEFWDDPQMMKKRKKSGYAYILCGIVLIVTQIVYLNI